MPIFDTIECNISSEDKDASVKQLSGMSQSPEEHAEEANDVLVYFSPS